MTLVHEEKPIRRHVGCCSASDSSGSARDPLRLHGEIVSLSRRRWVDDPRIIGQMKRKIYRPMSHAIDGAFRTGVGLSGLSGEGQPNATPDGAKLSNLRGPIATGPLLFSMWSPMRIPKQAAGAAPPPMMRIAIPTAGCRIAGRSWCRFSRSTCPKLRRSFC
jgi:hypothetical protein